MDNPRSRSTGHRTHRTGAALAAVLASLAALSVHADDWPQWMGPGRDGVWRETDILERFPTRGPKVLWRVPVAGGYSGPAVAAGKVVVTDYLRSEGEATNDPGGRATLKGKERVLCFRASDGQLLWKREYECPYSISYPAGPRTTPAIAEGKVYTLGAEGHLLCLDLNDGKILWSKDLRKEYRMETPLWGFCGHPLVEGNTLYCLVGGEGSVAVAFDKDTGQERWRALSAPEPGYCPPTLIQAGGRRQLVIWHPEAVNGLDPETGALFWSQPLRPQYAMSIAVPRQAGEFLFVSGIGKCAALYRLGAQKPEAEVVWIAKPQQAVFCGASTPFIDGDTIYGNDCEVGNLRAVRLATGERLWETFAPTTGENRRASHGTVFITRQADRYFLFSETGDLIIARLTPEKYEEISRAHLLEPTNEAFGRPVVWCHPAYANRCIFVRNDKELLCAHLAADQP
jgi:outer membrane protein assembly factor BamB